MNDDDYIPLDEPISKNYPQIQISGNLDNSNEFLLVIYQNALEYCPDKENIVLSYLKAIFESDKTQEDNNNNNNDCIAKQLDVVKEKLLEEVRQGKFSEDFAIKLFKSMYWSQVEDISAQEFFKLLITGINSIQQFLDNFKNNKQFNITQFFELLMGEIIQMKSQIITKLSKPNCTEFVNIFEQSIESNLNLQSLNKHSTWKQLITLFLVFEFKPKKVAFYNKQLQSLSQNNSDYTILYMKSLRLKSTFPNEEIKTLLNKNLQKETKEKIFNKVLKLIELFQMNEFEFLFKICKNYLKQFSLNKEKSEIFLSKVIKLIKLLKFSVKQNETMFEFLITYKTTLPANVYLEYIDFLLSNETYPKSKIKLLLEKLITYFVKEIKIWMKFIEFEKNHGNPLQCSIIFQKMMNEKVANQQELTDQYNKIMYN